MNVILWEFILEAFHKFRPKVGKMEQMECFNNAKIMEINEMQVTIFVQNGIEILMERSKCPINL